MIQYLEPEQIDRQKWDACIATAHNSIIFNYSWYLDATCDYWGALVKGDYEAVFPLPFKHRMASFFIFQPFFSRQLDVYSKTPLSAAEIDSFFEAIPEPFKHIQVGFGKIEDYVPQSFEIEEFEYQQLQLSNDYNTLKAGYSTNAKRLLKKAEKAVLRIAPLDDPALIVDMFKAEKGKKIGALNEKDFKRLVNLMNVCLAHNKGEALGVYNTEGTLIATGFFMLETNRIMYLKGTANAEGKQLGAMYFLFNSVIEKNAGKEMILDFGGSRVKSVAEFFKKFGAVDAFYLFLSRNNLPGWVNILKKSKDKLLKSLG
jgi:hypothetical protein